MDRRKKSDLGGFSIVPDWILYADLTPVTLKIWCILARFANRDDYAFPSIETIATASNLSTPTLRRSLKELESIGAIEIVRQFDENGRQRSNGYYLNFANPDREGIRNERGEGVKILEGEGTRNLQASKENETHINENDDLPREGDQNGSLFEIAAARWYETEPDVLAASFGRTIADVPKFAKWGIPDEAKVKALIAEIRKVAPNDEAVDFELQSWREYNLNNRKKGGQKDAIAALRNWYSNKIASWAVRKAVNKAFGSSKGTTIAEDVERRLRDI